MPTLARIATLAILALAAPAFAWNATGHRLVARIAWGHLTPAAKSRVVQLLHAHPHYQTLLLADKPADADPDAYAFAICATWPDLARDFHGADKHYHHGNWHYIDFPVVFDTTIPMPEAPATAWQPGQTPENALEAIAKNRHDIVDPSLSDADKAVALSWIEHLVGDIHQPLHAASLFSNDFPKGDAGGNKEYITVDGTPLKLHWAWDDMVGAQTDMPTIVFMARSLEAAYPESAFATQLQQTDPAAWAADSHALARDVAYAGGNIHYESADAYQANHSQKPPALSNEYLAKARDVARRQVTLAGYRLAQQLNDLLKP